MFKGLRQKIGHGLSNPPSRNASPRAPTSSLQPPENAGTLQSASAENLSVASCDSLINLNDDSVNTSLQCENSDSLIDISSDFSGPAVLDISGSEAHLGDLKFPHDRAIRSRTSSVSSQASDSFFTPVSSAFPSRQLQLPSDVESIASEAEEGGFVPDTISKDELYRSYCRMQQRSTKYRWKFTQVVKAYKEIEKERDKLKDTMTKSQDKAFRRISELKEQIQLDQLAKVDLEQNYLLMLEEKEELVKVLRTQITLLKQGKEVPEEMVKKSENLNKKGLMGDGTNAAESQSENVLKDKIARMSALLLASKESITKNRDQIQKLNSENSQLREILERSESEREQHRLTSQKKDKELEALVEKLKTELAKSSELPDDVDSKPSKSEDHDSLKQLEGLFESSLSRVRAAHQLNLEIKQELMRTSTENLRLNSETQSLLADIAEQKRALEIYTSDQFDSKGRLETASAVQHLAVCSRHKRCGVLEAPGSAGESVEHNRQTSSLNWESPVCNATPWVVEHGAGEYAVERNSGCIVCEKEQLLAAANEKVHACHSRIHELEETLSHMQSAREFERESTESEAPGSSGDGNFTVEIDSLKEQHRKDVIVLNEQHVSEAKVLKEQIERLERELRAVGSDYCLATGNAGVYHQVKPEDLRRALAAETEQVKQECSEELANPKEMIKQLKEEVLMQKEANESLAKSVEALNVELAVQRQNYEARLEAAIEEKQNLEEDLKDAYEHFSLLSVALNDVKNLKESLVASVRECVNDTGEEDDAVGRGSEERNSTAEKQNMVHGTPEEQKQEVEVDTDINGEQKQEETLSPEEQKQELDSQIMTGTDEEQKQEETLTPRSRLENAKAQIEELKNKNHSLHRLLHDWQGCIQMLKTCLKEKWTENEALKAKLQEAQFAAGQIHELPETSNSEVNELRDRLVSLEGENKRLLDQISAAEAHIENLVFTMNALKQLKDAEEDALKKQMNETENSVESRFSSLQEQKNDLQLQLDDLKSDSETQLQTLESKNKDLAVELEKVRAEEENLMSRVTELQRSYEESKTLLDAREQELNFLQNQLDELRQKSDSAKEVEESLRDDLARVEEQKRTSEDELENLRKLDSVLQHQVQELLAEKVSLEKRGEEQLNLLGEQQTELTKLKDEGSSSKSKMQKALKVLKEKNDVLSQQVKESEESVERLRKELQEFRDQHQLLDVELKQTRESCEKFQDEARHWEDHGKALTAEIEELKVQKVSDLEKLQNFHIQNQSFEERIAQLVEQNSEKENELQIQQQHNETVSEQVKLLEEEKRVLVVEMQDVVSRNECLSTRMMEVDEEKELLTKELLQLKDENKLLQCSLDHHEARRKEAAEQDFTISEELNSLNSQLIRLKTHSESLENKMKDVEIARDELEQKLAAAQAEVISLKELLCSEQAESKRFSDLVDKLNEEINQKGSELNCLQDKLVEVDKSTAVQLSMLRKQIYGILNPDEQITEDQTLSQEDEIIALRKILESELTCVVSTHRELKLQGDDMEKKMAEMRQQLEAAQMNFDEEKSLWKAKENEFEIQSETLRGQNTDFEQLVKELQEKTDNFEVSKRQGEEALSDKNKLLSEVEDKLLALLNKDDQRKVTLLEVIQEVEEKIANLSGNCAENERLVGVFQLKSEAADLEIAELTTALGRHENLVEQAEISQKSTSAVYEAEKNDQLVLIHELTDKVSDLSYQKSEFQKTAEENKELVRTLEEKLKSNAEEYENETMKLKLELEEKSSRNASEIDKLEHVVAEKDLSFKRLEEDLKNQIEVKDGEISTLQQHLTELENQLLLVQDSEKKSKEKLSDECSEKVARLMEEHGVEVQHLQATVGSHENKMAALLESLAELENLKEILTKENETLRNENVEMARQRDTLEKDIFAKLNDSQTDCISKDDIILELRKAKEDNETTLNALHERLTSKDQEIEKLQHTVENLQGEINNSRTDCQTKDEIILELRKTTDDNEATISAVHERLGIKDQEIEKFQQTVQELQGKIRSDFATGEILQEKERLIKLLEEKMAVDGQENENRVSSVIAESDKCREEVCELKIKIEELQIVINELRIDLGGKNSEIERLNSAIRELEDKNKDNLEEKQILNADKEQLLKEFQDKLMAIDQTQAEKNESHQKELENVEIRCQEKIKELQRKMVAKLKSVQAENEKTVNALRSNNEGLQSSKADLDKQLEECRESADQRQSKIDELVAELAEYKKAHVQAVEDHVEHCQTEMIQEEIAVKSSTVHTLAENKESEIDTLEKLHEALAREEEIRLHLEKANESIAELTQTLNERARELEELKTKSAEELKVQAERMETECTEKLSELKKKAEMRLKQIKSQIQAEKESTIAELTLARNNFEEQLNTSRVELDQQKEVIEKKEAETRRLSAEVKAGKDKSTKEISELKNKLEASKNHSSNELREKEVVLEESQKQLRSLEQENLKLQETKNRLEAEIQAQKEKISDIELKCKGLKKQLVTAKHEIDRLKSSNDVEVQTLKLENEKEVSRLMAEYKEQLKEVDIDNNSRIKQLVKDFQLKLAEKENEFQSTYMEALEKSQREEDQMLHQHKQDLKSLRQEMREREESYEESIQQLEVQLQAAEMRLGEDSKNSQNEVEQLKLTVAQLEKEIAERQDQSEVQNSEQLERQEQMVETATSVGRLESSSYNNASENMNLQLQQEVISLTRQIEDLKIRYSLQVIKDQADFNTEASTDSDGNQLSAEKQNEIRTLELHNMDLQAQVIQQCGDLAKLKIRERSLQQEIKVLNDRMMEKSPENQSTASDLPSTTQSSVVGQSTELQYLKNVLFKFMTGIEQQTLARVICTVLKFTEDETQAVLEHQSEWADL